MRRESAHQHRLSKYTNSAEVHKNNKYAGRKRIHRNQSSKGYQALMIACMCIFMKGTGPGSEPSDGKKRSCAQTLPNRKAHPAQNIEFSR